MRNARDQYADMTPLEKEWLKLAMQKQWADKGVHNSLRRSVFAPPLPHNPAERTKQLRKAIHNFYKDEDQ